MSKILGVGTEVIRVPPVRTATLEALAAQLNVALGAPDPSRPPGHDWLRLVEVVLPQRGFRFYPASSAELPDCEGLTDPAGHGPIDILIRDDQYDALQHAGRRGNRARGTVAHEFSHGILHVPYIRSLEKVVFRDALLARRFTSEIRAFENPEWQAWTLAGCIMAPRQSILAMPGASVAELAEAHSMSEVFMMAHLRRLRIEGR